MFESLWKKIQMSLLYLLFLWYLWIVRGCTGWMNACLYYRSCLVSLLHNLGRKLSDSRWGPFSCHLLSLCPPTNTPPTQPSFSLVLPFRGCKGASSASRDANLASDSLVVAPVPTTAATALPPPSVMVSSSNSGGRNNKRCSNSSKQYQPEYDLLSLSLSFLFV